MDKAILAPGAVLILWTVFMMLWMLAARLPALARLNPGKQDLIGTRGSDLDGRLPAKSNWPAHNYNHLMEQPTLFYAVVIILAIAGAATDMSVVLAWLYVMLRIMHSVWQATINFVPVRFVLFALSSASLAILAVQAVIVTTI